ncbi:MAG: hypothetical protein ACXWQZ_04195 [Ktedonobacterales bacterium]
MILQSPLWGWLARVVVGIALAVAGFVALRASSSPEVLLPTGGPTAQVVAGDLVLSLRVAPGPYFLSELLAVEMTLANKSQTAYTVQGAPTTNDCDQTMGITLTGGQAPYYTPLVRGISYCPLLASSTLKPGQRWTIVQMLPITGSGYITLSAQSNFLHMENGADDSTYVTGGDGPFAGRWPAVHLAVTPRISPGRTLTLDRSLPDRVTVTGPQGALAHLYSVYDVTCHSDQGYTEAPSYTWRPMTSSVLTRAECPGNDTVWKYSIGAPGYAITSGAYPPNE